MALSFKAVQKAYEVFNELKKEFSIPSVIGSWPEDMEEWSKKKREDPRTDTVYGFSKKSDDGWENIYFFVENPSEELKTRFDQLKDKVWNSSMSKPYHLNSDLWIFGWF